MKVLLLADHNHKTLSPSTRRALTLAHQLGQTDILVAGFGCKQVAIQATKLEHISTILLADDKGLRHHLAEPMAQLLATLSPQYQAIIGLSNMTGQDILSRLGGMLCQHVLSNVVAIKQDNIFACACWSGKMIKMIKPTDETLLSTVNADALVKSNGRSWTDETLLLTVNADAFNKTPYGTTENKDPIKITPNLKNSKTPTQTPKIINQTPTPTHLKPKTLSKAKIIIAGGYGIGSKEGFLQLETLANRLGASMGATKAAYDAGFAPTSCPIIGQSAEIIAPDIYIAIGISGAMQHILGIQASKTIIAINKNPFAPIFDIADFGLVAKWQDILPYLNS